MSPMKFTKPFRRKQSDTFAPDDANQRPVSSKKSRNAPVESSFRVLPRPDAAHNFEATARRARNSAALNGGRPETQDGYSRRFTTFSNDSCEENMFSGLGNNLYGDNHTNDSATALPRPTSARLPVSRHYVPARQSAQAGSTSSTRTNQSTGSSNDDSSARDRSYPTTPSTQDTTFDSPQFVAEKPASASHRLFSGPTWSFGGGSKAKAAAVAATPKPSKDSTDATAASEVTPVVTLKIPEPPHYGSRPDQRTPSSNSVNVGAHPCNPALSSDRPMTPSFAQPVSPGSGASQVHAIDTTTHNNTASLQLKPPEAEKRRSSLFLGLQAMRNRMSKGSTSSAGSSATSDQASPPAPAQSPPAAPVPANSDTAAPGPGPILTNAPALDSNKPGVSPPSMRHSVAFSIPSVQPLLSSQQPLSAPANQQTWPGARPNLANAQNRITRASPMRHSQVMDDLDSADHHDDSALLSGSPRRPATVQQTAVPPSTVPQTSDGDTTAAAAPPAQSAATAAGNDVTGQQTLTAATVELQPDSPVDADTSADASLAAKMEEVSLQAEAAPKKVLTAAQYARLRMETADASDDDDDEADSEPEEAEDEDDRKAKVEAQNQRMRQQAMLAIQRQRMMKVADGSGNSDAHRASLADLHGSLVGASASSPNLVATNVSPHGSTLSVHSFQKSDTSKDYNEDEDESIPLGILAVHGFPNKRRPPSKLMASSSNPNLTGGPGSVNSDYFPQPGVQAGLPPALPPFARKLPQDPYFGHGLVNQNPREPLAMGRGQQQPTAGLVGVIANEESARAARKRSPMQTQGPMFTGQQPASMLRHSVFGAPSPSQPAFPTGQQQMPPHPAMGQQYPGPDLLSMSTMAQTQMQLLELATKLNQQHAAASQQQPYAGPYGMQVPSAPMGYPMVGGSPMMMNYPVAGQRTMSMVDTSRTPFIPPPPPPIDGGSNPMLRPGSAGAHHAYAASIAPSERSNVGTASRYRPVSMIPSAMQQPPLTHAMTPSLPPGYPSTNTPGQGQGQGQVPVLMAVPQMPYSSGHQASSSVGSTASLQRTQTTPLPPSVSVPGTDARAACSTPSLHASESRYRDDDDEEDDEQAWLKMKQAREQNKGSWKFRRANTASVAEVAS